MTREHGHNFEVRKEERLTDYYAVLGVEKSAPPDEIRSAYRRLARKFHPDRNPERKLWAEEQMRDLNEAYGVLSDPAKKRSYDATFSLQQLGEVRQSQVNYYYPPPTYAYEQSGIYPRDVRVNLRRDRKGYYVVNAAGEKISDYFVQVERLHGFVIGVYHDLKKCLIHPLTGKPLTRAFKVLKFQNGVLIGVTDNNLKVAVEPASGRESEEYKDIKVENGRILGRAGLLKWQEIPRTFYVGD